MKICFSAQHSYWGGIDNTGGSKTVVRSVATLNQLGHNAYIASWKDKLTWIKHDGVKPGVDSDTDVVVAVGISDVPIIMKRYRDKRLVYWARPFELWQTSKPEMKRLLRKFQGIGKILCNSSWQVKYLARRRIKAELCFAGLDLEHWHDDNNRRKDKVVVGTLYSKRPIKQYEVAKQIFRTLAEKKPDKYEFVRLGKKPYNDLNDRALRELYNRCHIWLAPTKREGFHNVACEAAMCGCLLVVGNIKRNGMMDYCNPETAMIYNDISGAIFAIENPQYDKVPKMRELIYNKIGSRTKNMKRFVEIIND